MVDTYYDKMDRGLVPQLPGYQGYVARNPTLAPGVYSPAGGGVYGRAGARPGAPSPRAAMLAAQKRDLDRANAENLARYEQGNQLLGMPDPLEWQKQGFASESAYQQHQAVKAQEAANVAASTVSFGGSPGGGGAGGSPTQSALAARVQAKQRGIYNTSTALNSEQKQSDLELQASQRANTALALQAEQLAESRRRAEQADANQLRRERLEWIYNRNDQGPNLDRATQIAAMEGEGNTEGMSYPMASGGGQREAPQQPVMSDEEREARAQYRKQLEARQKAYEDQQKRKERERQKSYQTSRDRKVAEAMARRSAGQAARDAALARQQAEAERLMQHGPSRTMNALQLGGAGLAAVYRRLGMRLF